MSRSKSPVKLILLGAVGLLIAAFFVFDLGRFLTLDYLKAQQAAFQGLYAEHMATTLAAYFVIYVTATALSLPGATILTLAGGALFGLGTGLLIVSFASSLGATLAFLVSRYVAKDSVQSRFGDKLRAINEGIAREGAFYLFTLRLIPLFPFFVINLVMGLTPMRAVTFYLVSQIGMLPGTAVYVNAGTQLASLESARGILSPKLILSFALLGIFPLIAKQLIGWQQRRRALAKWPRPKSYDYNMVVIGAGAAGLVSSYIAAAVKAKVALIEQHKMGGDCLNTGCVPSKALIRTAKLLAHAKRAESLGLRKVSAEFDFAAVMDRVKRVVATVEPHDSVERYSGLGVECLKGYAKIRSPWEVELDGRILTTKNIVIASGAGPVIPKIEGLGGSGAPLRTSDDIWEIRELPKRMVVLGGGPIGCELAQCFARLGAKVTIIEMAPRLMAREDDDVSDFVKARFVSEGIEILTGYKAARALKGDGGWTLVCESTSGGAPRHVPFDLALAALGRKARVEGFGLEELGIRLSKTGTVEADPLMRTTIPTIYVCGDATGPYQFTHVASHQAWYAAVNALFSPLKTFKVDYRVIPWVTYVDPEVARVGLSEKDAKERGIAYERTEYNLDDLDRAIADEEAHGFVKVLTVPGKDKILGVTAVGDHAGDWFIEFVSAMKHGIGLNKILGTIHPYPTWAEANKYAAGNWKKAHAPEAALRFLQKFHAWRRT